MRLFSKIENSKDITDKEYVDKFYKKPTSGIPKSDLASAVQTSLGKADAAVPNTRKVNNKALSSDITLSASDVGALPDTTVIPDISGKANLTGGNTFTGKQTLNSPASDGYSINAAGYIKGSWLQASATSNKGSNTGKVCVFDNAGWIYYRTPAEILTEAGGATTGQIPTVNNGTLTIKQNGTDVQTFSANQSTNVTANITVPTKVSEITNDSGFTTNKGTVTSVAVKMNGTTKGTVTSSGTIDLGTVLTSHQDISGKLDKTTYEVNKTIEFGSSGVLYIGKFKVYDTNVTCEVTSTTNVTYSGKLVIATQNNVIQQMTVYSDAANTVAPNFFIKPSTTSDPYIEIYFKPASWSKNVVHIYGSAISAEPTNVCTNVSSVPSTATLKPTNALDNVSKHGYTQLTNEDLNTIIEPGWYNAAVGNSCTNKPSAIGTLSFYLTVEAVPGALRQTLYEPSWYDRWYARYYSGGWTGWNLQYSVNTSTQVFSGSKTFGNGINLTGALRVGGSAGTSGQVLTSTGTGTPQWTTLSNNVMTGEPEVNGASYTVFDSGEFGSFIGVFNTEAPSTDFQITVGRAVYTISSNEQAVAYRLTIDKGEDNVYSTIAVSGGTVDKSSDFGLIPTDGVVSISTNLESSYVESNKCVTIWGVI